MSWVWHLIAIWYYSLAIMLLVANHDAAWYGRRPAYVHVVVHILVMYTAFQWYGPVIRSVKWATGFHD